jgi:hypothetical protein
MKRCETWPISFVVCDGLPSWSRNFSERLEEVLEYLKPLQVPQKQLMILRADQAICQAPFQALPQFWCRLRKTSYKRDVLSLGSDGTFTQPFAIASPESVG